MVVQIDGTLRPVEGDIYKPHSISTAPNAAQIFDTVYRRAYYSGMTFRQAETLFALENNWQYPPRTVPLIPREPGDWWRKVCEVPTESLLNPPANHDAWRRRVETRRAEQGKKPLYPPCSNQGVRDENALP
jgi:hypothetical protein